jgi:hypothetical protein
MGCNTLREKLEGHAKVSAMVKEHLAGVDALSLCVRVCVCVCMRVCVRESVCACDV